MENYKLKMQKSVNGFKVATFVRDISDDEQQRINNDSTRKVLIILDKIKSVRD